ncbi:hypothetical protein FAGAP_3400 [Fusarium agapanthi]|uniref:Uncharacterized protein n=1 Tax=Fusarium agapanthi TaxID=1803897 RepID=A0A9P5EEZ7_9HYPO|nr:hypothetical protein FAGAP_3400 [Fusarium agapanthi]
MPRVIIPIHSIQVIKSIKYKTQHHATMPIIKRWGSTNAVDTEKLVVKHEFPVKRFCRMEKLRGALGDIFGSDDWVVEYDGHNLVIKVGSRVDLKEELKARGIIYRSMCTARAV